MFDLADSFKRELAFRKLTKTSINNYDRAFACYYKWLGLNSFPDDPALKRYFEWSEWLQANYAPATAVLYLACIRSFAKWAFSEDELDWIPPIIEIKAGPRKRQVIDDSELTKLLNACKHPKKHMALRNELIVRLLLDCGVRRNELLTIKLAAIDFNDMAITVKGKGNKTRFVYFGANTARAIDRYLRVRDRFQHATSEYLLLGYMGPLGREGLRKLIHRLCDIAGIEHLRPHMFRHTFAHDWLDNGGNPRDLMRVAGWSSDTMLNVYASERAEQRASNAHKRLSRGDRV